MNLKIQMNTQLAEASKMSEGTEKVAAMDLYFVYRDAYLGLKKQFNDVSSQDQDCSLFAANARACDAAKLLAPKEKKAAEKLRPEAKVRSDYVRMYRKHLL